jgi:hypothetical protein
MDLNLYLHQARGQSLGYRFDPWSTEVATMNHSARNIARAVDGLGSLIIAAFRGIGTVIRSLRKVRSVEVEPVQVAAPAHVAEREPDIRAAA